MYIRKRIAKMAAVAVKSLCECYFVNKEYLRPFSQTLHSDTGEGGVRLYFYCICYSICLPSVLC